MLTKDLLAYSLKSTRITPNFIDAEAPELLFFAEQMLAVFSEGTGKTRETVDAEAELYLQGQKDPKFAKGLYKILIDHTEFTLAEEDAGARRDAILTAAASQLTQPATQTLEEYRAAVQALSQQDVNSALYPDLPAFEQLTRVKREFSPRQLLQRYNMAQVQALLLTTQSLTLTTHEMSAANLRRIFKCLKFFRLLAEIKQTKDKTTVVIDGPLSLLEGTKKYGLQIASFFPVICLLEQWQISAKVQPKRAVKTLKLDESSQLVSHYRHMSAYVPEEVRLFASHFEKTVEDWSFVAESPFIKRPKGRLIFPDFTLQHTSGVTVYLEIFHRWHRGPLIQRMEELEKMKEPLILAIDRYLLKGLPSDDRQDALEDLDNSRHFLFSDYPAVSRLQKTLERYLANLNA